MFKPSGSRIAVTPDEERSAAGLIMPGLTDQPRWGTVVALGDGTSLGTLGVEVGDRVLYDQGSALRFEMDNEFYVLISQDDILGTM